MDIFRVRLNCVDHYQATPSEFDPQLHRGNGATQQKDPPKVPVIRVFGATETGQKVCAHIHGVFPYMYVEYRGSLVTDEVAAFIRTLHLSIDHALAVSYRRNIYEGKTAFVAHITLVKGIPFYGYNVGYKFFFKIYMLNPLNMARLADLLGQGAIMKRVIQPYESHMQYLAQWMCDYNLYGCAYINCGNVKFRGPVPDYLEMTSTVHHWHDRSIPLSHISDEVALPKQSNCSIEVDVCVKDILNRLDIKARPLHHDFIERTNPLSADEKLVNSMAGLWKDETRRRKARMGDLESGSSPFPPEVLISMSADARNSVPGGWIHEQEHREKVADIALDEHEQSDKRKISFDSFVQSAPFESMVKTALESVEDLYPENLPSLDLANHLSQVGGNDNTKPDWEDVETDESRIMAFNDNEDDFYESDEAFAAQLDRVQQLQEDGMNQQHSDEVQNKAELDDESRPDGESYGKQFQDPIDQSNGQGPTNSSELESLGVRKAGDLSHIDEDAFDVPDEYTSDIKAATSLNERSKSIASKLGPPTKKRKVVQDEYPMGVDIDYHAPSINGNGITAPQLSMDRPPSHDDLDPTLHNLPQSAQPHAKAPLSHLKPVYLYSQELSKANGQPQNKALSFPIVKDPHDPNTVLRLSQQSGSSQKGSQTSPPKQTMITMPENNSDSLSPASKSSRFSPISMFKEHSSQVQQVSRQLRSSFEYPMKTRVLCFATSGPSMTEVTSTMSQEKLPSVIYQDAYYSDDKDVPDRQREYAGREFKLESRTVPYLPNFDPTGTSLATFGEKVPLILDHVAEERNDQRRRRSCRLRKWEIAAAPPSRGEVAKWLEQEHLHSNGLKVAKLGEHIPYQVPALSQIEGPTQKNKHGFKYSQKQASTSVQHETQYMSVMSLELHVNTRGNLVPNPEQDEIQCVFWCVQSDDEDLEVNGVSEGTHVGILTLSESGGLGKKISRTTAVEVEEECTELDLITRMVDIVRQYDPDIITGYEVHNSSWGYMIERARHKYDYNLCDEFSRMKSQSHGRIGKENDRWGFNNTSTIRVTGRHMINIWRAMRGELNLLQYTMENVVFHLLHRRIPHFPFPDLTEWYKNDKPRDLAKVIDYYVSRVQMDLEILESNELVPRTSEQARLLGVDFFSVVSRGSQFKVESLMFRIAKPENFILVSPSRKQVGQQNALECLPLVMEPQSDFYPNPLLVLDFQSLYPSVMIAYNYCYSTFLGRVVNWRGQNKMGFTDFKREPRLLELFKHNINIAPNGIMYVKPEIRKSLLAKMLSEILETRVMVKSGMKVDKDDKTLQRLLNNRQLALKLIANVTYGYTSASFSGRMPCSEIADSIVQTGRETLEKAIAVIHSIPRWGAEVVYGDTDSLFVYLKGRTRDEAFDIGEEIAKKITNMNPRPVKLKFEKVYHPCVLLAKKRYVGFKYENRNQKEPEFDAKGIETVRRDGTPAEQKIEEKALKILFKTADLSQVKSYFQNQCTKIMKGKVSIQDFCFAKEVRLGTYSEKGIPPPGALISTRRMLQDPRLEPQYGERVPYVVITGGPGARLIDRCVAPDVLLRDAQSELDAEYYISKNLIPPLERIFNLVGVNVRQWYDEMPKFQRIRRIEGASVPNGKEMAFSKKTLESYMKSSSCIVCRDQLEAELPICNACLEQSSTSLLALRSRLLKAEKKARDLDKVCRSCMGIAWGEEVKCDSKDCPVFYSRTRHMANLGSERAVIEPVVKVLEGQGSAFDW